MSLTVFNNGKTLIDLDEVRMINGSFVIFKDDQKTYDIGEEAADAVHQMFSETDMNRKNSDSPSALPPQPVCKTRGTVCKTRRAFPTHK